jgi:gamma-butyrobetaine dioxygenase
VGVAAVEHDRQWINVGFTDGSTERFLAWWLRDNVESGRHRDRGQRTFDVNLLPEIMIADVTHDADRVTVSFMPEGFDATFDETWLRRYGSNVPATGGVIPRPTLWGAELQRSLTFADYPSLTSDPMRLSRWLVGLRDLGFALVENVPTVPGSIMRVIDLFGYVRETNYGRIFDVREQPDPANLAFTKLGIGMHTDNPYRHPVPGLQLLHCLVNESDGGDTQLCDGFAVAETIRGDHPDAFELLTTCPVHFRFVEDGSADLQSRVPLIELDGRGEVVGVRYNSRSIQAFDMAPDVLADFYRAYRILGRALHDPRAIIEFRLEPGQLLVFDNQRVLHGRSAYEGGHRHLQGSYADKDSLHSRIRILEAAR